MRFVWNVNTFLRGCPQVLSAADLEFELGPVDRENVLAQKGQKDVFQIRSTGLSPDRSTRYCIIH
jgi:hypothetical protein